ncbi:ketopantoate reductase PanE/ApbA C terminal-domain-containing protein [Apodospora peruviana]|uniref:Ketopantoate reductase PanE/ApbA C terminal-domain-containing protein n=1 Tax=Apodospora peruviana TaxID=516989 RepID=A0AAE0LZW6_9PEZI|nr:ketopantoate reductase PanE/ApbA C terminal-domain-containing protein [Apodospora peruviana]
MMTSTAIHHAQCRQLIPSWLQSLIHDSSAGPKLYSWTPANLEGHRRASVPRASLRRPSSPTSSRRIYVLGVGNLGRLYATSLAKLGEAPVTLVFHRKSLLEQWTADPGIEMTRQGIRDHVSDFDVEWWTEERPPLGLAREVCDGAKIQNLIVATKAPDAIPQADRLRRYLDASSTVAFVQNGMNRLWPPNGVKYNAARFPPKQHPNWLVCVTTHGVTSLGPFRSLHASPANVAMGAVLLNPDTQDKSEYLVDQILRAPYLSARKVSTSALWVLQLEKLVVNAIINPLTALLRCKNGLLFSNPGGQVERVMDLLLDEASLVLQVLVQDESSRNLVAVSESSTRRADTDEAKKALLDRFSTAQLRAMLRHVGEKVKDNTSSMLQDVTSGKQTEIREFNGWFVDTAEYLGVKAPSHKTICEMVANDLNLEDDQLGRYFPAINNAHISNPAYNQDAISESGRSTDTAGRG